MQEPMVPGGESQACCTACGKSQSKSSPKAACQVPGCNADLTAESKGYFLHRHICREHMQADDILCPTTGQRLRFCHQCGRLEPLEAFDGRKRSCRVSLKKRHRERRAESAPAILILHDAASCQQAISAAAGPAAGGEGFLPLYPAGPQIEHRAELLRQLSLASMASTTPSVNLMDVCLPAGFAAELQHQLLLQQQVEQQQQQLLLQQELCLAPGANCCNQQPASPPAAAAALGEAETTNNPAADAAMLEGDGQADPADEAFEAMLMQMLQEELAANAAEERTGGALSRTVSSASSCGSSSNDTADSTAHYAPSTEVLLFPPSCCNTNGSMLAPPASLACSSVVFTSPAQMELPAGAGMPAAGFCNAPVAGGLLAAPLGSMLAAPTAAAAAQQAWAARHARLSSLKDGMEAVRQELLAVSRALSAAEALNYQAQHIGCAAARLVSQLM